MKKFMILSSGSSIIYGHHLNQKGKRNYKKINGKGYKTEILL
jgi:hypothetical protein